MRTKYPNSKRSYIVCPTCKAKGYKTDVSATSYACKNCLTWWGIIQVKNKCEPS